MPTEPLLPPTPEPVIELPAPAPVRESGTPTSVACEFCGCKVTTARGQVLVRSESAKAFLDQDLEITRLKRELGDAKRELSTLKESVAPVGGGRRGTF